MDADRRRIGRGERPLTPTQDDPHLESFKSFRVAISAIHTVYNRYLAKSQRQLEDSVVERDVSLS